MFSGRGRRGSFKRWERDDPEVTSSCLADDDEDEAEDEGVVGPASNFLDCPWGSRRRSRPRAMNSSVVAASVPPSSSLSLFPDEGYSRRFPSSFSSWDILRLRSSISPTKAFLRASISALQRKEVVSERVCKRRAVDILWSRDRRSELLFLSAKMGNSPF